MSVNEMLAANIDCETYSEAGYNFDGEKWRSVVDSPPHGLGAIGTYVYIEHPSFRLLSLAYNLNDGKGCRLWVPGMSPPNDLFKFIATGGTIKAWNSFFEWSIWWKYCVPVLGWPPLPFHQLHDTMAASRIFGLPGKLQKASEVLIGATEKLKSGTALLNKFSKPRNPTKKDKRLRIKPEEDPTNADLLYKYNIGDVKAESSIDQLIPEMPKREFELWQLDQIINARGVHIDTEGLENCKEILRQANELYTAELVGLTGGQAQTVSELQKIKNWLATRGLIVESLDADHVEALLKRDDLPPDVKRVIEIRSILSSASVKKVRTIDNQLAADNRLHGLFAYYGANRTGRFAGRGPQPQNLKNSGPDVIKCNVCGRHSGATWQVCAWCGGSIWSAEWSIDAVQDALEVITYRQLNLVERVFGDALETIGGCLRGLFSAAPGFELICSDYSAIEAVVLAAMAGEEWRLEVFRTHGKIYEMSASKISGVSFEEIINYKKQTGNNHPLRKKIGKVAELASGYGGGLGAWKAFGADKHLGEPDIISGVKAWRKESPNIVKFWYGVQDAVTAAIMEPGQERWYKSVMYVVRDGILQCLLPSGRILYYHQPKLHPDTTPWGRHTWRVTYEGWNSNPKMGPMGWVALDTWGGKLTENIIQAVARDILTHAMPNLEAAGYPIVLHVHDEVVAEVPLRFGSIEQFETIMADLPAWCRDWPIKAAGGWRGQRYRKD